MISCELFLPILHWSALGLMTGRSVTKAMKPVLSRFYLALVLLDLWNSKPIHEVAEKFDRSRGEVGSLHLCYFKTDPVVTHILLL